MTKLNWKRHQRKRVQDKILDEHSYEREYLHYDRGGGIASNKQLRTLYRMIDDETLPEKIREMINASMMGPAMTKGRASNIISRVIRIKDHFGWDD